MKRKVLLLDTTLREGEQTPGVSFSTEQKMLIARHLDGIGIDMIELGDPNVSDGSRRFIEKAASTGLHCETVVHCRATPEDIDLAASTGADRLATFLCTSGIHLRNKLGVSRDELIAKTTAAVKQAISSGMRVRFAAEDATRTGQEFLTDVCKAAVEAGADRISIPDTVGMLLPDDCRSLFRRLSSGLDADLDTHNHNDLGLALANSLAALEGGATCVHVTVNGLGERSGITSLASLAVALKVHYGIDTVDLEGLPALGRLVEEFSGVRVPHTSPVTGENAFSHKAGVHTSAVLREPATYEPYPPELVNRRRRIIIGKYAGRGAVRERLNQLGIFPDEHGINRVVAAIKSDPSRNDLTDSEILDIAQTNLIYDDLSTSSDKGGLIAE